MYEGQKATTVSLIGFFLPTSFVESPIFFETMKWTYFVAAIFWFFNKLIPYSSWICTIGFTAVMGLYFENIYFSDHQGIMINMLMIIYCLWYHFYHRHIKEAIQAKNYWASPLLLGSFNR